MALASQLHSAHSALGDNLMGKQDLPEHHTLDTFYQSVKSSSDVQDFILRTAARLNLPIKWLPDRIAEQNFNLEEPPTKASAWVGVLLNQHLKVFRERLSTMPTLSAADVNQVNASLHKQFLASQPYQPKNSQQAARSTQGISGAYEYHAYTRCCCTWRCMLAGHDAHKACNW